MPVSDAVGDEISNSVAVPISVPAVLVKVWIELSELSVGNEDDRFDSAVTVTSETCSLDREIEVVVSTEVIVDNVDSNELNSGSDAVMISDAVVVTVDGTLSVSV